MNQHIKFFQALVGAGLSPYQAERVVREAAATPSVRHDIERGDWGKALLHSCTWTQMPDEPKRIHQNGSTNSYCMAYDALTGEG